MQAGVDDLETGVTQGPSDHLGPPVVAIETGLRHHDSVGTLHGRNTRQVPQTQRKPVPAGRKTAAVVTALLGVVTAVFLFALVANTLTKPGTKSNLGRS